MLMTILSHAVAFLAGGGGVFVYLHKHQNAAISAATTLATVVADTKVAVNDLSTEAKKL
jgi:hypothetical protein